MARFITPGRGPNKYARFYKSRKAQTTILNPTPIAISTFMAGATASTSATLATPSITPLANRLYLVAVTSLTLVSIVPSPPTLSGNGITWVSYANIIYDNSGTSLSRVTLFYGISAAPTSGVLTADFAAQLQDTAIITIDEATNVDPNSPVLQGATGANLTAATDLTIPLVAFGSTINATYAIFAKETTAASATPLGGLANLTYYDVSGKITNQSAYLLGNTLTPGVSWSTAVQTGGIAIELKNISTAATIALSADTYEFNDISSGSLNSLISLTSANLETLDSASGTISSLIALTGSAIESNDLATGNAIAVLISVNGATLEVVDTSTGSINSLISLNANALEPSDLVTASISSTIALTGNNSEQKDIVNASASSIVTLSGATNDLNDVSNGIVSTQINLTSASLENVDLANGYAIAATINLTGAAFESLDIAYGLISTVKLPTKIGGDDVPRKEVWTKRKIEKRRDESLESIIKAAYDKATGKVVEQIVLPELTVNEEVIAKAIIIELSDDELDEDDIEILLLGL